jgi:hypothetical protein
MAVEVGGAHAERTERARNRAAGVVGGDHPGRAARGIAQPIGRRIGAVEQRRLCGHGSASERGFCTRLMIIFVIDDASTF